MIKNNNFKSIKDDIGKNISNINIIIEKSKKIIFFVLSIIILYVIYQLYYSFTRVSLNKIGGGNIKKYNIDKILNNFK
jgi:hypothetical protein